MPHGVAFSAEERVVLQAIFGDDDFAELPGAADGAVRLRVAGETRTKKEAAVVFLARFPAEYPSHLPPSVELLEGVADAADAQFVRDSLALAFYEASVGAPVVHAWAEWLRDEWIASSWREVNRYKIIKLALPPDKRSLSKG